MSKTDELIENVREDVRTIATELDLRVQFAAGRRESDLLFVKVIGEKLRALEVPSYLLDHCPEISLEILTSELRNTSY